MAEQNKNWTQQEIEELGIQEERIFEKLPTLKLEENKVTECIIDFSKKFDKYETTNIKNEKIVKAIIPVLINGIKHNFWLNKKNPLYRKLLLLGENSQSLDDFPHVNVKLLQTGNKENTKYVLVK